MHHTTGHWTPLLQLDAGARSRSEPNRTQAQTDGAGECLCYKSQRARNHPLIVMRLGGDGRSLYQQSRVKGLVRSFSRDGRKSRDDRVRCSLIEFGKSGRNVALSLLLYRSIAHFVSRGVEIKMMFSRDVLLRSSFGGSGRNRWAVVKLLVLYQTRGT